ncbi:MAG: MFS transporter [Clostridiales bacterium]|nr:MFS transporter [Clostridiales bacterium]
MNTKSKFYLALVIFSLIGQVAWVVENMYFNVFIYKMFNATSTDISLMVSLSAVTATLTTLFIGALSDKVGKRKFFICGGYIVWGVTILCFAVIRLDVINALFPMAVSAQAVGVSLVIIMDCVMTFFGSSANDASFNAWLTESVDGADRGKVEGINSMMPLVAILVVFGGFMGFDLNVAKSWTTIFIIIGAVVLLIGVSGLFLVEDKVVKTEENANYFKNIIYGFRPSVIKENRKLYFYLIAFAVFGISIQIFMPYLILYYEVSLKMSNYVLIMAPAIILAAVFTFFYGRFYDKVGFQKSSIPSILILILGYLILFLLKDTVSVFIGSLLMMCGYLAGMAVFGSIIRDNIPENKAGMFQGLRIIGQVLIPGVIGPWIGRLVLLNAEEIVNNDGTTSFIPNEYIFLAALIVAVVVLALLVLTVVKNKKETSSSK